MLEAVAFFIFLASGIPGCASDERHSSTQPIDWNRHELRQ
jgi:hypothetical protein